MKLLPPPTRRTSPATALLALVPPHHTGVAPQLLTPGRYRIGSDPDCEIVLRTDGVSPQHALLVVGPNRALLRAWDHRTWVNDGLVAETTLRCGDRLSIGPLTLTIRLATPDELLAQLPDPQPSESERLPTVGNAKSTISETPVAQRKRSENQAPAPILDDLPPALPVTSLANEQRAASVILDRQPKSLNVVAEKFGAARLSEVHGSDGDIVRIPTEPAAAIVAQREAELTIQTEALATQLQSLAVQTEALRLRAARVSQTEAALGRVRDATEQLHRDLARQREQALERQQALDRRQDQLCEREHSVDRRETEHREREQRLTSLQQGLIAERARLEEIAAQTRDELAAEAERQRHAWQLWEETQERLARELNERFAELERDRNGLNEARQSLEREAAALQNERTAWEQDHQRLEAEQAAVRSEWEAQRLAVEKRQSDLTAEAQGQKTAEQAWEATRQQQSIELNQRSAALESDRAALADKQRQLEIAQHMASAGRSAWEAERTTWETTRQREEAELASRQVDLETQRAAIEQQRVEFDAEKARQTSAWQAAEAAHQQQTDEINRQTADLNVACTAMTEERRHLEAEGSALEAKQRAWELQDDARAEHDAAAPRDRQQSVADAAARFAEIAEVPAVSDPRTMCIDSNVHQRAALQAESNELQRQLQRERQLFAEQQAAWLAERELAWEEFHDRRRQMDADERALTREREALTQSRQAFDDERRQLRVQQDQLQAERVAFDQSRALLINSSPAQNQSVPPPAIPLFIAPEHPALCELPPSVTLEQEVGGSEVDAAPAEPRFIGELEPEPEVSSPSLRRRRPADSAEIPSTVVTDEFVAEENHQPRGGLAPQDLLERMFPQPVPAEVDDPVVDDPIPGAVLQTADDSHDESMLEAAGATEEPWDGEWAHRRARDLAQDNDAESADDRPMFMDSLIAPVGDQVLHGPTDGEQAPTNDLTTEAAVAESESPASDDAALDLRTRLAQMFGLPEDFAVQGAQEDPPADDNHSETAAVEAIADVPGDEVDRADEIAPQADHDEAAGHDSDDAWRAQLAAALAGGELTTGTTRPTAEIESTPAPARQPAVVAANPAPVTTASAPTEEDSISAYMERMLARNRRRDGDEAPSSNPQPARPVSAPVDMTPISLATNDASPPIVPADSIDRTYLTEGPKHKQDKDEVRAKIASFREVANRSARAALAKHTWRTLRGEIAVQGVLTVLATVAALAYWIAPLFGAAFQPLPSVGCSIAALWMGWQFVQTFGKLGNWSPQDKLLEQQPQPADASADNAINAAEPPNVPSPAEPSPS